MRHDLAHVGHHLGPDLLGSCPSLAPPWCGYRPRRETLGVTAITGQNSGTVDEGDSYVEACPQAPRPQEGRRQPRQAAQRLRPVRRERTKAPVTWSPGPSVSVESLWIRGSTLAVVALQHLLLDATPAAASLSSAEACSPPHLRASRIFSCSSMPYCSRQGCTRPGAGASISRWFWSHSWSRKSPDLGEHLGAVGLTGRRCVSAVQLVGAHDPVTSRSRAERRKPRSRATSVSMSRSWRRPRCSRDITVPIGVPMISAISL